MPTPAQRQFGVTAVELMVTLAVLAILLTTAAPSFQGTIASTRLTTTSNDLLASLAQARMEAMRRGSRVTVCMSANGAQCATTGTWSQGWISFTDTTRAGATASLDNGETLISSTGPSSTAVSVAGSANVAQFISFGPDGRTWTMAGAAQTGTIRICSNASSLTNNTRTRDLILIASGRIITQKTTGISSACPAP